MIVRSLKQEQYNLLCRMLDEIPGNPLDASRTVTLNVGGDSFALKLQPEKSCRVALLQAVRADRRHSPPECTLVTKGRILSALLELFLIQYLT